MAAPVTDGSCRHAFVARSNGSSGAWKSCWSRSRRLRQSGNAAVAMPANEDADATKVAHLARLGGIGVELATVLVREALYRPLPTASRWPPMPA